MSQPAHILLVDDELSIQRAMAPLLRSRGYAVTVAGNGREALDLFLRERIDLVILDLGLPDMNGLDVCRQVRERADTPILILSARGAEKDKVAALDIGADDYVTKPFGLMELLARVEALLRRSAAASASPTRTSPPPIRFGAIEVRPATHEVLRDGQPVMLRPKEFDLLMALIQRNGQVATRTELLYEVWGYDSEIVSRTVDTHMAELRRKLEDDPSSPKHLLTVRKTGYRLRF